MARKRVHEIAKAQGLTAKELLEKLHAAGIEAKAASSSVEEDLALSAIGRNGAAADANGAPAAESRAAAPPPRQATTTALETPAAAPDAEPETEATAEAGAGA